MPANDQHYLSRFGITRSQYRRAGGAEVYRNSLMALEEYRQMVDLGQRVSLEEVAQSYGVTEAQVSRMLGPQLGGDLLNGEIRTFNVPVLTASGKIENRFLSAAEMAQLSQWRKTMSRAARLNNPALAADVAGMVIGGRKLSTDLEEYRRIVLDQMSRPDRREFFALS